MTKYYVDVNGNYIGGFQGVEPPKGSIEVPFAPSHGLDLWINGEWVNVETAEQITKRLESALDKHIDQVANSYGYESIRTMVTYENDPFPKFHNEGVAAKKFRSACYVKAIDVMTAVQKGQRPIPTEAELIAAMPRFTDYLPAA